MDRHAGVFDNIGRVYLQQKCIWTTWQVFLEHADCGLHSVEQEINKDMHIMGGEVTKGVGKVAQELHGVLMLVIMLATV